MILQRSSGDCCLLRCSWLARCKRHSTHPRRKRFLAGQGWPIWLIWPALAFNAAGAAALILGVALRPAAAALAAYCAVTSLFHFIPDDPWQMTIFVKNWAIAGGLLVLAAQGGGRWVLHKD